MAALPMPGTVYVLVGEGDGSVGYVGATDRNPSRRLGEIRRACRSGKAPAPLRAWVSEHNEAMHRWHVSRGRTSPDCALCAV